MSTPTTSTAPVVHPGFDLAFHVHTDGRAELQSPAGRRRGDKALVLSDRTVNCLNV
jgi:hypothetical protein